MSATPFLDFAELRKLTGQIQLSLGGRWTLAVYQDEFLGPHLRMVGTLRDNQNPGQGIDIGINSRIPPCRGAGDYIDWVLHRWVEVWVHEARETFLVDGKLWSDPHALVTTDGPGGSA